MVVNVFWSLKFIDSFCIINYNNLKGGVNYEGRID